MRFEVRFDVRNWPSEPLEMRYMEAEQFLRWRNFISVCDVYDASMGKNAEIREGEARNIIYLGRYGGIQRGQMRAPILVASM